MGLEEESHHHHFLSSDWDQLLLVNQGGDFGNLSSYSASLAAAVAASQGFCSSTTAAAMNTFLSNDNNFTMNSFNNLSLLGNNSSTCSSSHVASAAAQCYTDFPSREELVIDKNLKAKKRKGSPLINDSINGSEQQQNDASSEDKDKEIKNEVNQRINAQKSNARNSKEQSQNCETGKEDYIHVRAKRGQATNSHSLAERVRREKISERMRLLQDLVPGCNKITGKAVMLDEIINYVQSLQRQVEFLSMKLAAVNPELNLDIDQILSKDLYQRQALLSLGMGRPLPEIHGLAMQAGVQPDTLFCNMPGSINLLRTSTSQISPMNQMPALWNHELQHVATQSFIQNQAEDSKEPSGSEKREL